MAGSGLAANKQASTSFAALEDYLSSHPLSTDFVMGGLAMILSANVNANRVFLPALQTVYKLVSSEDIKLAHKAGESSEKQ